MYLQICFVASVAYSHVQSLIYLFISYGGVVFVCMRACFWFFFLFFFVAVIYIFQISKIKYNRIIIFRKYLVTELQEANKKLQIFFFYKICHLLIMYAHIS